MSAAWKHNVKELLTFSKKERLGFAVLVAIVLVVLLYPLLDRKGKENEQLSFGDFAKRVDSLEVKNEPDSGTQGVSLFMFDPNTADSLTFLKLGFSPKQVTSILLYRSTGAWFSKPDDFSKLYVVSEEQFRQLKPYIRIEQPSRPFRKIELNTADTTELQRLRGIGPYYARQIARYREQLGGFYSAAQLKEIKGIDNERFSLFAEQYTLNAKLVKPINIGLAAEDQLKAHPYIGSEAAGKIVEYRRQIPISSLDELLKSGILPTDRIDKLSPYLTF